VIRRRYQAGLDNFAKYAEQVDNWSVFNNDDNTPIVVKVDGKIKRISAAELKEQQIGFRS
jgi:predicted ABC-type ATPase